VSAKKSLSRSRGARVTLRTVAEHLGISTSTVSLALREHPSISPETRAKVMEGAKAMGYRPDPEISKLMSHLRAGWKPGFKSAIYALTTRKETEFSEYHGDVAAGAKQRAEEMGYGFILKYFDPLTYNPRVLQRTLIGQGVEGILLLPMAKPIGCENLLDWSQFSVVSATYAVLSPEFHRVVPHQFSNVRLACREMAALGYQRIGLIQRLGFSAMVNHAFAAAVLIQNLLGPTQAVTPFLYDEEPLRGLKSWFEKERPDALIVEGEPTYQIVAKELKLDPRGPIGIALTNRERSSKLAGIDELGASIGRAAIDVLAFKLQTGDKGIPNNPVVTMIEGKWISGPGRQPPVRSG